MANTETLWTRIGTSLFGATEHDSPRIDAATLEAVAEDAGELIAKVAPTTTIGTTSTQDMGGIVFTTERNPLLVGSKRFDTYDVMVRNTSIIAAGVRLFLNLLARAEWTVNPAEGEEDNPRAQEIADQAYEMMFDMTTPWSTIVRKQAMYRFQGFAVQEWTAKKREDGAIGMLDVENRPQRTISRWNLDKGGTVQGCYQQGTNFQEVELPRGKILYSVDDTLSDSPEGMGLYRHLAETAHRLTNYLGLEEIAFETDLRGIPVARAPLGELRAEVDAAGPAGSTEQRKAEAQRTAKLQPLKDFIGRHIRNKKMGLLLPSDTYTSQGNDTQAPSTVAKWGLELVTGDSQSMEEMAAAINRLNQELARVLGCEHLLLGSDGSGSLALAKSKVGTFYLTVTSTLSELVEVFERDWLGPIAELNGWPPELIPSIGVQDISDLDVSEAVDAIYKLAQAGATVMPNDPAVGEIYDKLGLTRPPEDNMDLDASLSPRRNEPANPENDNVENPDEAAQVAKRRMIWSKRSKSRRIKAEVRKRAELRKAA